jgi:hypothetical protein
MKNKLKINSVLIAGALALTLALIPVGYATDETEATVPNVENTVEETTQDQTAKKRKEMLNDATSAIRETQNALQALDEKNNKEAIAALERATGKLEIILAREPELALAPSGVSAVTYDILSDIDAIKALSKEAEDALEDGRVQEARHLIRNLASETVISVTNIPLATYPDAIKLAAKHIDDDKTEEAKKVLQTALNTLFITNTIIPLPVVRAEHILKEAETLAEKAGRSEEENKHLADLLKDAHTKLKFAEALGYGSKKDFKNLYEQLDQINDKTEGGKSGTGFFAKIKGYLKDTVKSSQSEETAQAEKR